MNPIPSPSDKPTPALAVKASRYTAQQWDKVRSEFCSSILADTALSSLAQNLEGVEWPLTGPDEVPTHDLALSFDELRDSLAMRGQPPKMADHLIDILKETLAFDTPFGEMVTQSAVISSEDNPLTKNLARLNISPDFPVVLTALSADTKMFCQLEKIITLGELALAAQRMAGAVIVGGDFRELLNALSNIDETMFARYLPFRPGSTGLHYVEGLAQGIRNQPADIQAALARRAHYPLAPAIEARARTVNQARIDKALIELQVHAERLRGFCEKDYADLQQQLSAGVMVPRLVAHLKDVVVEAVVIDLIAPRQVKPNAWKRLFTWWRR